MLTLSTSSIGEELDNEQNNSNNYEVSKPNYDKNVEFDQELYQNTSLNSFTAS